VHGLTSVIVAGHANIASDNAWAAWASHFQPQLEAFAHRAGIPRSEWHIYVDDLLADEALRLNAADGAPPKNLSAYLVGAARHRHLARKRSDDTRQRLYAAASENRSGERIVTTLCSEHALRASAGPAVDGSDASPAVVHLIRVIDARLTATERLLLAWVAEGIPRPRIAQWLGITPAACDKRVSRLRLRLRLDVADLVAELSISERRDVERVLRRASVSLADSNSRDSRRVSQTSRAHRRTRRKRATSAGGASADVT
jgi:DNA-directed RNA polymerase specialized sigma24 family protein